MTLEVRLRRFGGHLNLPAKMVLTCTFLLDVSLAPIYSGEDIFAADFIVNRRNKNIDCDAHRAEARRKG